MLIGVGSNQGASLALAQQAIAELSQSQLVPFMQPESFISSRLWRTSPVDCPPDSDHFINAVVGFLAQPTAQPEALLKVLKGMEQAYGRGRKLVKNAPRELDLDLLVFGQEARHDEHCVIPHPRAVQRKFVLVPAVEIAPDLVWPGQGQTIRVLLDELQTDEQLDPVN